MIYYKKGKHWQKWLFSRATVLQDCPRCGNKKNYYCLTPSGKRTKTPHTERVKLQIEQDKNQ